MIGGAKLPSLDEIVSLTAEDFSEDGALEIPALTPHSVLKCRLRSVETWRVIVRIATKQELLSLVDVTKSLPIIGIAMRCEAPFDGKADSGGCFAYLPLPDIRTGLPVHIHGTFQLTDNRRNMWLASKDTDGQATKWITWNSMLLYEALPQIYGDGLMSLEDTSYYSWPDPSKVESNFRGVLAPLSNYLLNLPVALRCDGSRLEPSGGIFLAPTENEKEAFRRKHCLEAAVKLCQDLGHDVVWLPLHARSLLTLAGVKFTTTVQDIYFNIVLPHWHTKHPTVMPFLDGVSDMMLALCKVLGVGPVADIQRFRRFGADLHFLPIKFPDVHYGSDDRIPLKPPSYCYDPAIQGFRLANLAHPPGDFRSPEVLRVLRQWGLRQTLSWADIAQEAVCRVCAADSGAVEF